MAILIRLYMHEDFSFLMLNLLLKAADIFKNRYF